jgi:hypothetical protein
LNQFVFVKRNGARSSTQTSRASGGRIGFSSKLLRLTGPTHINEKHLTDGNIK